MKVQARTLIPWILAINLMACSTSKNHTAQEVPSNADVSPQSTDDTVTSPAAPVITPTKDLLTIDQVETWYEKTRQFTDTTSLERVFQTRGYDPGPDAYAFVARIYPNDTSNQVYAAYSYRDSAFVFSLTDDGAERFWPASTVKLTAAVMALMRLESLGLDVDDPVTFVELDEVKDTNFRTLVQDAIIPSDNEAYNALMLMTGLDRANDTYLRDTFHFPTMVLQRRYFRKTPEDDLRTSPEFTFQHANKVVTVPSEKSSHYFANVPREANATTLVELAEMLRRVMTGQFLNLTPDHFTLLRDALHEAPSCVGVGVERVHPGYQVFNKGGRVIGDDRLEIAYITDTDDRPVYLLALSLPYSETVDDLTNEFAWQLITAIDEIESHRTEGSEEAK